MLYRPPPKSATAIPASAAQAPTPSPATAVLRVEAPKITGHTIARRVAGMSTAQSRPRRGELYKRGFDLPRPTIKRLAAMVGVSAPLVYGALKLDGAECARVNCGLRPVLEPKLTHPALPIPRVQ